MLKGKTDYAKDVQILAKNALLFHLVAMNKSANDYWLQIHDLAAGSGTSAVPEFELLLPAQSFVPFGFHSNGWQFGNGIYVRAVTAAGGTTLIASNDVKYTYQYDGPWPIS
jgi:hypothetical protein